MNQMKREFARPFYDSPAWKHTRKAYASSVGGLCERCLKAGRYTAGVIVHHIIPLNENNVNNQNITLNWNNLELVCRNCHQEIHKHDYVRRRRYVIDSNGRVITNN